ncbi:MAG: N-6 DNA methylase, partial [Lentisphaerae bacterium]|nr:N-6 DNA methylase [Lentisphaerota bacterium]
QFRTPRHIIDFMVEVIAPKKGETILDPACGTAGFLISAYKHILRKNDPSDPSNPPDTKPLTPDEKGRLAKNFKGYDISPDMVRLSLVNLYLHGFSDPHIYEYDTLTSEERWNEYADVILANPPFMSPKGGIKPHKRFSIQAKRSEVLFVDYMAEHLTPTGRAAIIVPEGIIFQSQGAYKELRKMLVENSLVAVVSLPAGCFNPYSGVKTSILILDKSLARQSDTIAFFKAENDGFGLGAQRRAIEKNDLPHVQSELATYLHAIRNGESTDTLALTTGLIVPKEKIAANGDYNLSGERYREGTASLSEFPHVSLGEVCEIYQPKTITQQDLKDDGAFVVYGANGVIGRYDQFNHEFPEVIVTCRGATCGTVNYSTAKSWITGNAMVFSPKTDLLLKDYLFQILKHSDLSSTISGSAQPQITRQSISPYQIPLPPLEIQKEIVAEIEGYQKVINGARAVLDHYRPHIPIHPDWPMVELGEVCDVRDGTHDSPKYFLEGYPLITSKNLKDGFIDFSDVNLITREDLDAINKRSKVDAGDLLMPMIGTIGNPVVADASREYAVKNVALIKFPKGCQVNNRFLKDVLDSAAMQDRFQRQASGSTQKFIPLGFIRKLEIPLPPLAEQQAIVAEIEAEQALVNANRELITRMEAKIQSVLSRIWGEVEKS